MFAITERLFLRPLWPEDAPSLARHLGNWSVAGTLGRSPWPYALDDAESFIAEQRAEDVCTSAAIFLRTSGGPVHVGGIGFRPDGDELKPLPELGFWIAESHWGQGIAVEAGRAVLEYAFLGHDIPVMCAGHYADNPNSGRVLEKLGFRATGEILAYPSVPRGCIVDSVEYELTREDWRAAHHERASNVGLDAGQVAA
ncbi:MAG: GNAT family N-acetyltransferase [Pacificimonas sp.]